MSAMDEDLKFSLTDNDVQNEFNNQDKKGELSEPSKALTFSEDNKRKVEYMEKTIQLLHDNMENTRSDKVLLKYQYKQFEAINCVLRSQLEVVNLEKQTLILEKNIELAKSHALSEIKNEIEVKYTNLINQMNKTSDEYKRLQKKYNILLKDSNSLYADSHTLKHKIATLEGSIQWKVGNAIYKAFAKPGINTLKLPYLLVKFGIHSHKIHKRKNDLLIGELPLQVSETKMFLKLHSNKKSNIIKNDDTICFNLNNKEIVYLMSKNNPDFEIPPEDDKITLVPDTTYRLQCSTSLTDGRVFVWIFEYDSQKVIAKSSKDINSETFFLDFKTSSTHESICLAIRIKGEGKLTLTNLSLMPVPTTVSEPQEERLPAPARNMANLHVAYILDELTEACLKYDVKATALGAETWEETLNTIKPDFLFVESCWSGNQGCWGALTQGSGGGKKLKPVLEVCKRQGIPTVFWNKEDPVYYDRFIDTAKLFDFVFTSDVNMLSRYKEEAGISAYGLPFAAQPRIHNPTYYQTRKQKAVFAGSYYSEKTERCQNFASIINALELNNINYDIYDRCQDRKEERFRFPEKYTSHIIGQIPADDMWKVHKAYRYQINVNSVKNSSTMFARRVFESLASGTPVLSNYAKGIEEMFPGIVLMSDNTEELSRQLMEVEKNVGMYEFLTKKGIREVMRQHTYAHRLQYICDIIGLNIKFYIPSITLKFHASNMDEAMAARQIYNHQSWTNKRLLIVLEPFENAYHLLNASSTEEQYFMNLDIINKVDPETIFHTDFYIPCEIQKHYEPEFLEDYIYEHMGAKI